jgi:hypothetical protein
VIKVDTTTLNVSNGTSTINSNYIVNPGSYPGWISSAVPYRIETLLKHDFTFIKQCFPLNWDIVEMRLDCSTLSVEVNGEYKKNSIHSDLVPLTEWHSVWSPSGTKTYYKIHLTSIDFEKVHKEVFDSQFIEDFESVEV